MIYIYITIYIGIWFLSALQAYRWGKKDGQSSGYLRGYRDGGKGKTFKRDKETY